jgi:long-chain acyl-CoA synthetase
LAVSTAAALPLATAQAFDTRFGVPLSQALGIIEVGLPFINTTAPREKPQSIGKPMPDVAFEIRDTITGEPVSQGEVGELFVRAGGMLDAYLNPWRVREELAAPGGWFGTGDLAVLDADGYLSLVGRAKTVINVAGMKCFPEEVEAVIQSCAGVKAVRVFGREHPRFGMVPVAEIIPLDLANPPTVGEIATRCRNTLARYKVPVDFRFVESLPRTASGKIKR